MRFYRYFSSHAFETLQERMLMVSRLSAFNDPFEFLYRSGGVMTIGKAKRLVKHKEKSEECYKELQRRHPEINTKRKFKAYMRENRSSLTQNLFDRFPKLSVTNPDFRENLGDKFFRICCFTEIDTEPLDEILMWSHYANKHHGVRIGFELDHLSKEPYFMRKVVYSKHRVAIDSTTGTNDEGIQNALIEAIHTKSEGWKYEREYRFIMTPNLCEERIIDGKPMSFCNFESDIIWTVDFGVKCPDAEKRRISKLVKEKYPNASLRSANYHKTEFSLEYTQYKYT